MKRILSWEKKDEKCLPGVGCLAKHTYKAGRNRSAPVFLPIRWRSCQCCQGSRGSSMKRKYESFPHVNVLGDGVHREG